MRKKEAKKMFKEHLVRAREQEEQGLPKMLIEAELN